MDIAIQFFSVISTGLFLLIAWKAYGVYQRHQAIRREEAQLRREEQEQKRIAAEQQQLEIERQKAIVEWHKSVTQGLQVAIMRDHHYEAKPDGTLTVTHPPLPRTQVTEIAQQQIAAPPAALAIPGRYDMREVWYSGFRPSTSQIWLAKGATDGIAVPANKLLHSIATGPTGGGKCLEENEPVFLADGRVLPAKFLIGKSGEIIGVTDTKTMQQTPTFASFADNGVRTVIEIELDNGVVLKRTEEHPLWAAQLDENQHVGIYRRTNPKKSSPRTRAIKAGWIQARALRPCGNRPNFDGHVILCPVSIEQEGRQRREDSEVTLCASLLAEGGLTNGNAIRFTSASSQMVESVSKAVSDYGCTLVPVPVSGRELIDYRVCNIVRSKGTENKVSTLVREWGMKGCSALQKRIPQWVFQLPNDQIALFLRVFVDCDGWFNDGTSRNPSVNVSLANADLVQQIGQLALRLGIAGTYTHKSNGHAGAWTWSSPMVDVWQEKIGSLVKTEALARAVSDKATRQESAATNWNEWRQAHPTTNQTFADCPEGYEWRKVKAVRIVEAPTVSIEVYSDNHAYVGYAVEHNTNIVRMELMQLIYIGCEVTLMDIHYAPIKTDEDSNPIDWRPIVNHLAQPPIYNMKAIIAWMKWLAYTELENRITRQRTGQPIGKPIFFTIAELPAVIDEIAEELAKILRQGRQYLIFFVGDSQDLLTKTLHMSTGPREAFRTGFYTGGDLTTAKALLDLPNGVKLDEEGLGQQGLVYLKTAVHPYTQARVGWASNESLYDLFQTPASERIGYTSGRYTVPAEEELPSWPSSNLNNGKGQESSVEAAGRGNSTEDDTSVKRELRDIGKRLRNKEDRADILRSYGATSGRANQEIGAVVDMLIEQIEQQRESEAQ